MTWEVKFGVYLPWRFVIRLSFWPHCLSSAHSCQKRSSKVSRRPCRRTVGPVGVPVRATVRPGRELPEETASDRQQLRVHNSEQAGEPSRRDKCRRERPPGEGGLLTPGLTAAGRSHLRPARRKGNRSDQTNPHRCFRSPGWSAYLGRFTKRSNTRPLTPMKPF